ncbi:27 kDa antigen [Metarhizium acridum CQMa 102]|uniref:27 kDa antigen n=1 Tax=Metarhizium acridum (strain CQMa 102) TaxID=655827 RepID=E9EH79_METAQ|nr:27 kDa antigen [Metarhizium acridum CQMa 102]EFY84743.1 27 kDa antigen [Metarhizium acridum CQMa 102]
MVGQELLGTTILQLVEMPWRILFQRRLVMSKETALLHQDTVPQHLAILASFLHNTLPDAPSRDTAGGTRNQNMAPQSQIPGERVDDCCDSPQDAPSRYLSIDGHHHASAKRLSASFPRGARSGCRRSGGIHVSVTSAIQQSISTWLLQNYPTAFVAKKHYGVFVSALAFHRSDGSVKHIKIEIFDVNAWPQRPQYNLDSPDNDVTMISISGVQVPVFNARWLLREKIVTAFKRQGTRKEKSDLDDACALLDTVEPSSVDLTNKEAAVRHLIARRPCVRQSLELKIVCPAVLGLPWTWNEPAAVYWRREKDQLR